MAPLLALKEFAVEVRFPISIQTTQFHYISNRLSATPMVPIYLVRQHASALLIAPYGISTTKLAGCL